MKLGKNFLLGIVDEASGAFMPLAFAQSCSYNVTNKLLEVSSPLVGGYDNYRKKTTGWTMKHEGLIGDATLRYTYKGVQYDFIRLISVFAKSGEPMLCRWHENDEIKQGLAIVKSVDEVGSVKALAKISVSLQGTGELKDLDPNNLEGTFAYVVSSRSLLLYTISRPIAGFTPFVGTVPATTTWDPVESDRVQQFEPDDDLSFNVADAVTAVRGTTAQQGVSFVNSTTLHVVLLQTDTRDDQQQLHRYVQPLWWGGYALGDMEVKNAGNVTILTLPTSGAIGSIDPVEVNPSIDVLSPGALHIDITGTTGQTAHCCDRTATLDRIFTIHQTSNHIPSVEHPYWALGNTIDSNGDSQKFRCNFRVWANDADGNEICSYDQGALIPTMQYDTPIPSAQNIHWQLEGLGVDEGGPWNISRSLTSLLEPYNVYYAYDATAQKLTLYSPDSPEGLLLPGVYLDNDPNRSAFGFYDLDSEGKRIPKTFSGITSFESIAVALGNGVMHDVSSLQVVYTTSSTSSSGIIVADKLPLADVLFTDSQGHTVTYLPALTTRAEVGGYDIAGAQMESGATQTVTFSSFYTTVRVTASVEQQDDMYLVNVRLRANGSYVGTPLPGNLTLQWPGGGTLTILAGDTEAQDVMSSNVAWQGFTATLDYWGADAFNILTTSTIDVTPANWKAYKLGTLNGKDLYDIQYVGTVPEYQTVYLTGDGFVAGTVITSGTARLASHLMKMTHGATPTMDIRMNNTIPGDEFTLTFEQSDIITDQPVVLYYRWTTYSTVKLSDKIGAVSYSRRTNIGEAMPYVRARTTSMSAMYAPVLLTPLAKLGDEGHIDEVVRVNVPQEYDDSTGIVEFSTSPMWGGNALDASGITGIQIYGTTGTQLFPRS